MRQVNQETFLELIYEHGEEIDSESWRHGRRVQFLVEYEGSKYLTAFLDQHHEDGLQLYGDRFDLFPAKEVTTTKWVRA